MKEYCSKDLKETVSKISSLAHKATMEFYEFEKVFEKIKKSEEKRNQEYSDKHTTAILLGAENLIGRKIKRVNSIENYWSSDSFVYFECDDGQRIAIRGNKSLQHLPNIDIKDMKESQFYTEEEIQEKYRKEEAKKERIKQDETDRNVIELERLKKELGK